MSIPEHTKTTTAPTPVGPGQIRSALGRFVGSAPSRDDAYLAALVRAHLLAPDAAESDGNEEDCLAQALEEACDRLGLDMAEIQGRESARLREEGLL